MGKKSKSSRKGKKAWRANISTEDIEDYFDKSTKDALSGGSLTNVPSESLFFVDNTTDTSIKRKTEKNREKVLHCDSLLQRNAFIKPVPSSQKKSKEKRKKDDKKEDKVHGSSKDNDTLDSGMVDLWADEGENVGRPKKKVKPSLIPAVEVEPSGCSFNPSTESHQESLARAVADEMQKIYRRELRPEEVPLTVIGEVVEEEDKYFLDADENEDGDDDLNVETMENEDTQIEKRLPTKRVTRVEFNRRTRRKEQLKSKAEVKKVEDLSKEIDSLPKIVQEIAKEDEEKHNRKLRRNVAKQERLKSRPARLGRHKFDPAPLQVLLSEEISGSLRKLKACCTLAKDRYKSLEKRGLIVPTVHSSRK
ncbi:ribosome biogenesis protein NOP53 [Impatiens glandulifera]|uniref:ribosome biogenesis protein NOP53 n=1 Tax=Impatiens glandulifera TaxID=253017 RepID=UPI001FB17127|nr:ribosome biogenesis protein NOP53 [Impatiens glandulifera]